MSAIVLATLFGSLLGGGVVMAINARRLGRPMGRILLFSALGSVAALALLFVPRPWGTVTEGLLIVGPLLVAAAAAKRWQEPAMSRHQQAGGAMSSLWGAAGIGLLAGLTLLIVGTVAFLGLWAGAGQPPSWLE